MIFKCERDMAVSDHDVYDRNLNYPQLEIHLVENDFDFGAPSNYRLPIVTTVPLVIWDIWGELMGMGAPGLSESFRYSRRDLDSRQLRFCR